MSFEVITIEPGDIVLCDLCNKDFTNSDQLGGFLFSGKAVCPECEYDFLATIKKYKEQEYIKAAAQPGESFRSFVYRVRKGIWL